MSLTTKSKFNTSKLQVLCRFTGLSILLLCFSVLLSAANSQWQLNDLEISSDQSGVVLKLGNIEVAESNRIESIEYKCPDDLIVFPKHNCQSAELSFIHNKQKFQSNLNSQFNFNNNHWSVSLTSINNDLQVSASSSSAKISIVFNEMVLSQLIKNINHSSDNKIPEVSLDGLISFDSDQLTLTTPNLVSFSGLSYEYSDDAILADLNGSIGFKIDINTQELNYELKIESGEMLLNDLYVDFSSYPLSSDGQVKWQNNGWYKVVSNWQNKQSLNLFTSFEVNQDLDWQNLKFAAQIIDSFHFNQNILGSILGIYGFGSTEMSGVFTVEAESNDTFLDQWRINFDDFYVLNERRKIVVESLSGSLNWNEHKDSNDSSLNWNLLSLAGLPINKSKADFNISADTFNLIGDHSFPVFDGQIEISQWEMSALFSDSLGMSLNAKLLPISLKLITEKMGWPSMAGKISGNVPGMQKDGQVIKFLGALNLDVFEGNMLVNNLSIERLFGVAPVIAADVRFERFDLSLLTETFGFGLITGKLHGEIDGMRITNWKTDRLNAQVYTVKSKGVKQTISQRAIDNISSLGGIQGAISKTFLRFFDDFRYSKIKLSCKLHNSVCQIGGIKNTKNQFTIVEGGGIPNINIVGFVRSIDWDEFISRLLNANYDG